MERGHVRRTVEGHGLGSKATYMYVHVCICPASTSVILSKVLLSKFLNALTVYTAYMYMYVRVDWGKPYIHCTYVARANYKCLLLD